jgi:hypothetical protein
VGIVSSGNEDAVNARIWLIVVWCIIWLERKDDGRSGCMNTHCPLKLIVEKRFHKDEHHNAL